MLVGCQTREKKSPDKYPSNKNIKLGPAQFVFHEEIHNFGNVNAGEQVIGVFEYENIGGADAKIVSVKTSCGCMEMDFSEDRLKPGEQEQLEVVFNTSGEWGNQMKSIDVITSYGDTLQLMITARVENEQFKNFY